jgi:hypothetical protein
MAITKVEIKALMREFEALVEADVNGITASDARRSVATWLYRLNRDDLASYFEASVLKYQDKVDERGEQ